MLNDFSVLLTPRYVDFFPYYNPGFPAIPVARNRRASTHRGFFPERAPKTFSLKNRPTAVSGGFFRHIRWP